jgi:hypothetical protein
MTYVGPISVAQPLGLQKCLVEWIARMRGPNSTASGFKLGKFLATKRVIQRTRPFDGSYWGQQTTC